MTTAESTMKIRALAPWFGNNRLLAERVGAELGKLAWCGVPFMGGAPELPFIRTRAGVANDLHRHVINLARCVADVDLKAELIDKLDGRLFHPDELARAQRQCRERERVDGGLFGAPAPDAPDVDWAASYFVACWMGRGGAAGKAGEFNQSLSMRWTASGGGSAKRFRSAIESLEAWHLALRGWEFTTIDAFAFIGKVKDEPGQGLYVDAPWPDAGDDYTFPFDEKKQRRLAERLSLFSQCRVVVRFGDHPLIRELYQERDGWRWVRQTSRDQKNGAVEEVLIVKKPSDTEVAHDRH